MKEDFTCPHCQAHFVIKDISSKGTEIEYCPFCRRTLNPEKTITLNAESNCSSTPSSSTISFIQEHVPESENILFSIGPYQIIQSIGKGGMGEVFLAYDTTCGRRLALKKIRPDLVDHAHLHNRFIKEARITSQLTHPAIIPIYAIHNEHQETYYTMPFVEGRTLKQLLRMARQQELKGEKMDHIAESIPALLRIFLTICQAVAYAHSKHILHRDLKPENIIVGQYGQIVILDWGLAKLVNPPTKPFEKTSPTPTGGDDDTVSLFHLTHVGKIVGTVSYMAPERAIGMPANYQTDIYSLGVILYQLLTLKHPFQRESLKDFRKNMFKEKLYDPVEIAPYRDVPPSLSLVVMKCLSAEPEDRYQTVDQLIHDLENYIEGRSEWFKIAQLDINKKSDWEFQENVFIAEHVALTRGSELADWVNLMISKNSFQETIKLEAKVKIGERGHGIGFLLSVPESAERQHLNDGYCLWLGTEKNKSTKLLRSTVEVMNAAEVFLKTNEWHDVRIEKIENNIHVYLDGTLQFSYISHLPLPGKHVGLLVRDADFSLSDFSIFVGNQNVTVNCLAVPDAFLAHKDYSTALNEYRRIGLSFPGRAEGREAMFRAGITLLEEANNCTDTKRKLDIYDLAQEEFHKLHNTPGAPLEYLGKALVYQALEDSEEEAKCFELAYRRYPRHPLLPILEEQIVYRMHDSSRSNRQATFGFILLAIKYLPKVASSTNTLKLLQSLERHWEPLFFIDNDDGPKELVQLIFAIKLAFWLGRPYAIAEFIDDLQKLKQPHPKTLSNALFCLIELGSWQLAEAKLKDLEPAFLLDEETETYLQIAISAHASSIHKAAAELKRFPPKSPSKNAERVAIHLLESALDAKNTNLAHELSKILTTWPLSGEARQRVKCLEIWNLLLEKNWTEAGELLHQYPLELLSQDTTLLHFLYGCWLYVTEGKEIALIHFSGPFEVPYPRSWNLFSYYIRGKINSKGGWLPKSFLWERKNLYRQVSLFYICDGNEELSLKYTSLALEQVIQADT